ncbi:hypothetical protein [Lapidilactobacillus salsurivasis]
MTEYQLKQKDIVWLDLNPQKGRKIKKYRPAGIKRYCLLYDLSTKR